MSQTSIPPRSSIPARRRRILIVEDEPGAREGLFRALSADYDVVAAADGLEGVDAAIRLPPDLILSDVSMPRLGGLPMVKLIRARLGRKVPVIFLTANDSTQAVIDGIAAGARHYLTKPVDIDDLGRRIRRLLGM
jgi:DNA-binding response OmpR family regulator